MKKIKIFSLLSILLAVFSLTSIIGRAEGEVKYNFTPESGLAGENNNFTVSSSDVLVYTKIEDMELSGNIYVSLKFSHESIENLDIYFHDTEYVRVAYKVAGQNDYNNTYTIEKNEGEYACTIFTVNVTNGVAETGITKTNYVRFKLRGLDTAQSLVIHDMAITSDGNHGMDFSVPTVDEPTPEEPTPEPTEPLAISDLYTSHTGFEISKEENGDQVITYSTAPGYNQIFANVTNCGSKLTTLKIKFTVDQPVEIGYCVPEMVWDSYGHKNYEAGTYTESVPLNATSFDFTLAFYIDATNEFPIPEGGSKTLTIHSIKLVDPTVYDETEPTTISDVYGDSVYTINKEENGDQVISFNTSPGDKRIAVDVTNCNPNFTMMKIKFTVDKPIEIGYCVPEMVWGSYGHKNYEAGTYTENILLNATSVDFKISFYIDLDNEFPITEGGSKTLTIHSIKLVDPNAFDPTAPANVISDLNSNDFTLVKENGEISFTYGEDGVSTSMGYPTLNGSISNYNAEYTVFKIVYSSAHEVRLGSSFNGGYKHISYPAGNNMEAIIYLTDEKYASNIKANMDYMLYIDAEQTIDYQNTLVIHSMSFELPPQGMVIQGPAADGLKVEEVADGHKVIYGAGSWVNVFYSFVNYDVKYDVLALNVDLIKDQNMGIRVHYVNADGSTGHIDVRNHGNAEGIATVTGTHNLFYILEAYGLKGKELTKVELWFDPANGNSILTGEQTALIRSFELLESSKLNLAELEFTAEDATYVYDGEKVEYAANCEVEGVVFKYHHASIIDGEQSKWYDGLPAAGGTYKVKVTYMGSADYNWKEVIVNIVIEKADQENNEANISIDQETGVITIAEGVEASFTEDFTGDRIANGDVIPFDVNVFFRIPGNSNYNVSEVLHKSITRTLEQQIAYEVELIEEKIAGYEEDSRIQKLVNPLIEKIKGAQDKSDIEIYLEDFDDDALTSLKETIDAERALTKAQNEAKSSIAALILGYEEEDSIKAIVNPIIAKIDAAKTPAEVEAAVAELNVEVLNEAIEVVIAARNLKNEKDSQIEFINDYVGEFASQINVQAYIDRINQATSIDEVQEIADEACDFIDDQKDIIALQPTKDDAIEELEAIDLTAYRDAEKTVVEGHINDAKTAINAATTLAGVESALETAKTAIALVKTAADLDAEELDAAKNAAYDDIDEAADPSDYQTEEQTALVNIINKAKADINEATTIAQVESLLNAALEDIDALWTTQDYIDKAAKDLADAKTAAKAELDTYLDKANYREAQHADIDAAIAAGKSAIDGAGSTDVVTSAMNDAKAALDAIKTDAELDAEEAEAAAQALAAAKEAAIAAVVAEIGSYNIDKTAYVNAINAATSTDAVQTALTNAKSDIATKKAAIDEANKPAPQPTPEPQPQPTPEPSKKGCKGSLVASIFGMVALLGACLTFKRKKD